MPRNHTFLSPPQRYGFTLTEILISITLMLLLMLAVARIFQYVGNTVTENRAELDASKKLRTVQTLLERDLSCITVPMTPPRKFADNEGYFCYIEGRGGHYGNNQGPSGNGWSVSDIALDSDSGNSDTTISDTDDIIMFTARSRSDSEKFRGLVNGNMTESHEAEICWFVRGTTLYRRVLLIVPDSELNSNRDPIGFFNDNDISVHLESNGAVKANTLADLGRRENRYGHWVDNIVTNFSFPYPLHNDAAWYWLRLPTMADTTRSSLNSGDNRFFWQAGKQVYSGTHLQGFFNIDFNGTTVTCNNLPDTNYGSFIDFWLNPYPWIQGDGSASLGKISGSLVNLGSSSNESGGLVIQTLHNNNDLYVMNLFASRDSTQFYYPDQRTEDVVLTNVIGFNVQAWDPDQNAYTDLYSNMGGTMLSGAGNYDGNSGSRYGHFPALPGVYDTWTDAYELQSGGVDGNGRVGIAVAGINPDNSSEDYMKHVDQWTYPPPYPVPLRGIQVKIRVMDPSTHLIKEVTVKADFRIE